MNLFRFLNDLKSFKNMQKMGAFIARAHVDATWHTRPRGSATWTRECLSDTGDVIFIFT